MRGLPCVAEHFANALLQRRRDLARAQPGELALEPALELGARVAAAARAQVPLDLEVVGGGELAVEILREEAKCVLAAHAMVFSHWCSGVRALSRAPRRCRAATTLSAAPRGRAPSASERCRSGRPGRRQSRDM